MKINFRVVVLKNFKKELKNQKEFWDIFNINYGFKPKQTIICPIFFQANLELIN
tara:strand:+ start:8971 stop:9132 length:162 start_codon:yes stop_codon:yes gene_type:complete